MPIDYQKYIDYIKNTGGSPTVEMFKEDWEPIGEKILTRMLHSDVDLISLYKSEFDNIVYIKLTEKAG